MGIYKVIKIKLPKFIQNLKPQHKQKKKTYPNPKKAHSFLKKKKKVIPTKRKKSISLQQTVVILFLLILFAKGICLWYSPSEKEIESTAAKTDFFLKDSLPY